MTSPGTTEPSQPPPARSRPGVMIATALPLAMCWLALYLTHVLPDPALASIAIAIVVYTAWLVFSYARSARRRPGPGRDR
jgi:hypothetical protein